jgi:branched-chain amino acid transport system ATP-binding protein
MAEALLETRDLCKSFGGLVVTDAVSLVVAPGEIHAIIGPNGAGKTTLIAELAGELSPDSGSIRFAGADITRLATARRAALGIARSFQITSIFREFSVLDNVAMAVQAHAGHSFRFWRSARRDARLRDPARQVLAQVGLAERAESRAAALSHGEKRALEIAPPAWCGFSRR